MKGEQKAGGDRSYVIATGSYLRSSPVDTYVTSLGDDPRKENQTTSLTITPTAPPLTSNSGVEIIIAGGKNPTERRRRAKRSIVVVVVRRVLFFPCTLRLWHIINHGD